MGVPELADDPAFSTREARREHQQDVLAIVGEWAATKTKEEIYHTLQGMRTIAGLRRGRRGPAGLRPAPEREFFQDIEHPHAGLRRILASQSGERPHLAPRPGTAGWGNTTPRYWAAVWA